LTLFTLVPIYQLRMLLLPARFMIRPLAWYCLVLLVTSRATSVAIPGMMMLILHWCSNSASGWGQYSKAGSTAMLQGKQGARHCFNQSNLFKLTTKIFDYEKWFTYKSIYAESCCTAYLLYAGNDLQ
jgi:hypothetical protein